MSQIASFYLLKDGQRQELSNGDCSGAVYMAIWDWCESELDLDVRFPAPQTEDTLDCALLEGELASNVLAALREQDLPELAAEIAPDWDLPTEAVQSGLETLRSHLELVRGDAALLYEMIIRRRDTMLAKRFEDILHKLGLAGLEHPLFYHAPVGIRFEIGGEEQIYLDRSAAKLRTNPAYVQGALNRAAAIYRGLPAVPDLLRIDGYPDEEASPSPC